MLKGWLGADFSGPHSLIGLRVQGMECDKIGCNTQEAGDLGRKKEEHAGMYNKLCFRSWRLCVHVPVMGPLTYN